MPEESLLRNRIVRIGVVSWAGLGIVLVLVLAGVVFARVSIVTVPLVLALFPAAVLVPVSRRLEDRGLSRTGASIATFVLALVVLGFTIALVVNRVEAQAGDLADRLRTGYAQLRDSLLDGVLGLPAIDLEALLSDMGEGLSREFGGGRALEALATTVEGFAAVVLGLIALFFYVRDGDRIAAWLRDLLPASWRDDASAVGERVWTTVGGYIRGQTLIALIDAVLIGIGLAILQVPLALVLAVLVFIGGFVPIVGAFVAGAVAVLVALAAQGVVVALIALAVIVGVQQLEGHLLAPLILGRTTALHPLAVLVVLTAGAALWGILGAILSVPVAASIARSVGYLRSRSETSPAV
ncbi:MAG: AI-2E family transporter [Nitriliruptorales bacterium]